MSVNGHAKQNDKQNGKAKAGKLSEQIEETSGNGDQNSNKKVDAGAQNEDLAVNKQERPIQLQKKEVAKTKAAKKDKIATAAKPLFNRIELGMKAGYERGTNSNAASKYVISPYLQYNLSPKVALMTQPAIKYAQLSTRSIGNNQTYYKVIEGGQTKQNGASTPNVAVIGSTVDTISYTTNYTYTATYDSIIKSYKTGGAYLELELPILVKYKLGKKLSVYGGANFTYNKLTGIKENTFTKHDVTRSLDFSEVTPVLPVTTPVGPGIQYSGNPISNYNGPAYQVSTAGRLNVGYMLGFTYEVTHRWLFDALMEQSIVNRNIVGNYDVNAPLSSVYFRLSAGYKFIK